MKKILSNKQFKVILLVGMMLIIFFFSHQSGSVSTEISEKVAEKLEVKQMIEPEVVIGDGYEYVVEPQNISYQPLLAGLSIRKYAHVLLYALLGMAAFWNVKDLKYVSCINVIFAGLICFAYSCFDEVHQMLIPGRGASVRDVAIDAIGYGGAILLCYIEDWRYKRKTSRNKYCN